MLTRRTPMRRTSIERGRKPLPAKREVARRSSYFEDRLYLVWVRMQRCAIARALGLDPRLCSLKIDPDHLRAGAGMSQRSPDPCAYPACRTHHEHQHLMRGVFADWTRADIDALCARLVADSQASWYGRALVAADLDLVRSTVAEGRSTRALFSNLTVDAT